MKYTFPVLGLLLTGFLFGASNVVSASVEDSVPVEVQVGSDVELSLFKARKVLCTISVEIEIYVEDQATADRVMATAFKRIEGLFNLYNDYVPDTPINKFCEQAGNGPQKVDAELYVAFKQGIRMHQLTDGVFDITAKPYTLLWRMCRERGMLPPPGVVDRHREFVDIKQLKIYDDGTASLDKQGMWLDVGGLVKGRMCDLIVDHLKEQGVDSCSVMAGGDMAFGDAPPSRPQGWPVDIPDVLDDKGESLHMDCKNEAVSVSGDAMRYFEVDGVRYAHIINPKTGLGLTQTHHVCVRGPRGFDTDPLATAGCILGDTKTWREALKKCGAQGWVTQPKQEESSEESE